MVRDGAVRDAAVMPGRPQIKQATFLVACGLFYHCPKLGGTLSAFA